MSIPSQYHFGQGIDWTSPLMDVALQVELPFWLMVPPGPVVVSWSGVPFAIEICPPWIEVFVGFFTDSRSTRFYSGPLPPGGYEPPEPIRESIANSGSSWMRRDCKTVLRLTARAHVDVFRDRHGTSAEQEVYFASLCEAHLPVVNELIQRYRLVTYDPIAHAVSAWDVPIWLVSQGGTAYGAVLLPYKSWDRKPTTVETGDNPGDPPMVKEFEWASRDEVAAAATSDASPGEFDLLDAKSMMERGDYSDAVRRIVTAIDTLVTSVLGEELVKRFGAAEGASRLEKSKNDAPGRLRQLRRLARPQITDVDLTEADAARELRRRVVHEAYRLTHEDRGNAQRALDTGRWLYNKIEAKPDRQYLREHGIQHGLGRIVTLATRFRATLGADGITLAGH